MGIMNLTTATLLLVATCYAKVPAELEERTYDLINHLSNALETLFGIAKDQDRPEIDYMRQKVIDLNVTFSADTNRTLLDTHRGITNVAERIRDLLPSVLPP